MQRELYISVCEECFPHRKTYAVTEYAGIYTFRAEFEEVDGELVYRRSSITDANGVERGTKESLEEFVKIAEELCRIAQKIGRGFKAVIEG